MSTVTFDRDILPVFAIDDGSEDLIAFCGTGFLLGINTFVTCWHNVRTRLPEGQRYVVVREKPGGGYSFSHMANLERDRNGTDLALANVGFSPEAPFRLAGSGVGASTRVWSFGYPLTDVADHPDGGSQYILNARYLEGYVTRDFYYPGPGGTPSYELDMPAPAGLSGGPVVRGESLEVVGVVFGTHDVAQIEQFASIDPDTGEREPEIQRIVSFGLALHTEPLRAATGPATGEMPLGQFLDNLQALAGSAATRREATSDN